MGKLNIAHHKSYHPYRRDNIERVRRDEEEARLREAVEEGRMMLAVSPSFPTAFPMKTGDMGRMLTCGVRSAGGGNDRTLRHAWIC